MSLLLRLLPMAKLLSWPLWLLIGSLIGGWQWYEHKVDGYESQLLVQRATIAEQGSVILRYQAGATAAEYARDRIEYEKAELAERLVEKSSQVQDQIDAILAMEVTPGDLSAIQWLRENTGSVRFESSR